MELLSCSSTEKQLVTSNAGGNRSSQLCRLSKMPFPYGCRTPHGTGAQSCVASSRFCSSGCCMMIIESIFVMSEVQCWRKASCYPVCISWGAGCRADLSDIPVSQWLALSVIVTPRICRLPGWMTVFGLSRGISWSNVMQMNCSVGQLQFWNQLGVSRLGLLSMTTDQLFVINWDHWSPVLSSVAEVQLKWIALQLRCHVCRLRLSCQLLPRVHRDRNGRLQVRSRLSREVVEAKEPEGVPIKKDGKHWRTSAKGQGRRVGALLLSKKLATRMDPPTQRSISSNSVNFFANFFVFADIYSPCFVFVISHFVSFRYCSLLVFSSFGNWVLVDAITAVLLFFLSTRLRRCHKWIFR